MTTFAKFAREFATGAAAFRRELQRTNRDCYVAAREVEVLGLTSKGERTGSGEPDFLSLGKMSGAQVRKSVEHFLKNGAVRVAVEVGYDAWENFAVYARQDGSDYEPRIDHFSMDVPEELLAVVRREIVWPIGYADGRTQALNGYTLEEAKAAKGIGPDENGFYAQGFVAGFEDAQRSHEARRERLLNGDVIQ